MPFTPAHAAAAVPIHRMLGRRLRLSALVIGSMSPDFEYILRLAAASQYGHTFVGLFAFCLPVGLFAYVAFHTLLKRPLALLLPDRLRVHAAPDLERPAFDSVGALVFVCLALVMGAVSHDLWDAFTHKSSDVVVASHILSAKLIRTSAGGIKVYNVLQHLSSVLGLALLARWSKGWATAARPLADIPTTTALPSGFSPVLRRRIALAICLATLLGATMHASWGPLPRVWPGLLMTFAVEWAVGAMATLVVVAFVYAVVAIALERRLLARRAAVVAAAIE